MPSCASSVAAPSSRRAARDDRDEVTGDSLRFVETQMYAPPPRLNLLVIRSPNIDRAARFYSALGLLMTKHAHADGPEHYTSQVDRCVFEIYPLKTGTQ